MKLSYVIPVYNVENYLRQCIDSILAQGLDDYEIILVDDESPDGCPQLCDEYAERFPDKVKVIHQKNTGPSGARNSGLDIARGDYIFFADSDDYLTENSVVYAYERAVELDVDILQNSYISYDEKSGETHKVKSALKVDTLLNHNDMQELLCRCSTQRTNIFAWRNLYKREFLIKNKLRFDENLRMIEDPPFNTQAFLTANRFLCIDSPCYVYRIRDDSLQRKKYIADYDLILEYQWEQKNKFFSELGNGSQAFYEDIADFTIRNAFPIMLQNIYLNPIKEKYSLLKRIGDSRMMRKSFEDYDIDAFKSKSLDWWMTYFIKKRMYPAAHLICKYILYKNK